MPADLLPQNIRLAARTLRREPTFLVTAVLSLAVAIALNTTLYTMFDAMLEPRVAGGHPERVYTLRYYGDSRHVLPPDAVPQALATGGRTYDALSGYRRITPSVGISSSNRARETMPVVVRPNFFDMLGVRPLEGTFVAAQAGEQQSIVISDRLRAELFPDTRTVVGTSVMLDGRPSTIVAVVHPNSGFTVLSADVWSIASRANDEQVPLNLIRAREGSTGADVYNELTTLAARLALAAGEPTSRTRFFNKTIMREFTMWSFHYALIGGVVAILLVACANLGNLQLARSLNRGTEIAVRSAIGARPRDIVGLLLTEVGIIAGAGLVLGLFGSAWGVGLLRAAIPEAAGGFFGSPEVSWRMVLFAVGVSVFCVVVIGLVPAVRASRADLNGLIKRGAGTGAHRHNRRRYGWLLIVQIGLTLPVVSAAVLLARGGWQMRDPFYAATQLYGFDPDSLVDANVTIAGRPGEYVHIAPIVDRLLSDARAIPDVSNAAVLIYSQPTKMGVTVADSSGRVTEFPTPMWSYKLISPGYYRTLGLPIERGVDLMEGAYDESAVIVDRATSTFFWPNGYRPGSMVKLGDARSKEPWLPVKGVRGDHLDPDARLWRAWFDTLRVEEVARVITRTDSVPAGRKGIQVTLCARAPKPAARGDCTPPAPAQPKLSAAAVGEMDGGRVRHQQYARATAVHDRHLQRRGVHLSRAGGAWRLRHRCAVDRSAQARDRSSNLARSASARRHSHDHARGKRVRAGRCRRGLARHDADHRLDLHVPRRESSCRVAECVEGRSERNDHLRADGCRALCDGRDGRAAPGGARRAHRPGRGAEIRLSDSAWLRLDELDRQPIGILDHERARVSERMWRLEHFHAVAPQLCVPRIEIVDAECDVIQHLPARRNELLIAATTSADALPRIPRHRPVAVAHTSRRLPNRSDRLE